MEPQPSAPPLVAVVVADRPGEWFEEALSAVGSQDYPNQSVLVIGADARTDPAARVAAVLPEAYLRRPTLPDGHAGFAAAANDVLETVQGAAFLVFCHDDVAPEPEALRLMVEEALRSNAGIVGPKLVDWDHPELLLHVGLLVDKTGACGPLVEHGELDQEQHDAVRDVFAVASACMLVRADLFAELGGFDPALADYGADLDLCWRAQVAGARVVVAPNARVRHREGSQEQPGADPEKLRLEPRYHMRAMLKSYSWLHILRVLPQAAVVTVVEVLVALFARRFEEARDLVAAWGWNVRHFGELRPLRRAVRQSRAVPDSEVRRLQARGSVRLTSYLQRRLHAEERTKALVEAGHELVESVGRGPGQLAAALVAVLVLAVLLGSRHVAGGRLPAVGQLAHLPGPFTLLRHYFDGWRTTGMGSTSPAPPAFGVLGVLGMLFGGRMGALQKLLVLGAWPVGALGAWRLARPLELTLARLTAVVAYLAVPLPYNLLANGRWSGLLAYAAGPWLLAMLARMGGVEPFDDPSDRPRGWRPVLKLGVVVGAVGTFVPSIALAVVLTALGLALGSLLAGGAGRHLRVLLQSLAAVGVAAVLLLPWSASLVGPGGWSTVAGVARLPSRAPGLGTLLRFQVGPLGAGLLGWALLAAAALPLFLGRSWRFAWAVRFWMVTVVCVGAAWAGARGWLPVRLQSPDVLLAPAAAALAGAVGVGAASSQLDVRGYRFGWRQISPAVAGLALVLAVLPVLGAVPNGRWNLTTEDVGRSLGWMQPEAAKGAFRVLWVGDPAVLPIEGWDLGGGEGVAFATSRDGVPDATDLWPGPPSGATDAVAGALRVARRGGTARLGRLLAPMAVRYVVVPRRLSTGTASSADVPVPAGLTRALGSQLDLRLLPSDPAVTVYENTAWGSGRAALPPSVASGLPAALEAGADLSQGTPVLPGRGPVSFDGRLPGPGTVLLSEAPSSRWSLTTGGQDTQRLTVFGVANAFVADRGGAAELRYRTSVVRWLAAVVPVLLWAAALRVLWRSRRRRPPRRQPPRRPAESEVLSPSGAPAEPSGAMA
jgi:GT2 family glycosyltransferase